MDEEGMIDVILDIWRDAWKGTSFIWLQNALQKRKREKY